MSDDLTSTWPNYRIDPRSKQRLETIPAQARDRTSLTKVINAILAEALAQIESIEDSPPAIITIHRLRRAIGNPGIIETSDTIIDRVMRLEEAAGIGPPVKTTPKGK